MQDKKLEKKKNYIKKLIGKCLMNLRGKKAFGELSNEYDLPNSSLNYAERGMQDTQITTLWRIVSAHGVKMSEFFKLVEDQMPDNWSFHDK